MADDGGEGLDVHPVLQGGGGEGVPQIVEAKPSALRPLQHRLEALPDGGGVLITPTNSCLGRLDPGRISKLDAEWRHVGGDPPSKEVFMHRAVLGSRPEAGAVVHLHSTHATAISCLAPPGDPAPPIPPIVRTDTARLLALLASAQPPVYLVPPGDQQKEPQVTS